MDTLIEKWLRSSGPTLSSSLALPRGLNDRFRFAAEVVKKAPGLPKAPVLAWRGIEKPIEWRALGPRCVVGREAPADLVIPDGQLSRRHCALAKGEEGVVLEDLSSRNGTFVNGERVKRRELLDGDVIEVGRQLFLFLKGES